LIYFGGAVTEYSNAITAFFSPLTYDWINLAIVLLIGLYCAGAASIMGRERYGLSRMMPNISDQTSKGRFAKVLNINAIFLQPFVVLLVLIFGAEVASRGTIWVTAFSVEIFSTLLLIALNYSLMKYFVPVVNVFCVSRKIPLKNVMLLKMNKDNIKLREKGKTIIVERGDLLRVEIVDAAQEKKLERSIVPFATWIPFLLSVFFLWSHNILLAFLVGLILPLVLFFMGAWLFGLPPVKNNKAHGSFTDEIQKVIELFSAPIIIALIIALIALILTIIGAWGHYGPLLFYGGILPTFVSWALFQIYYPR
jgi:hypothetical protein